jgi:hypothetical protein
MNSYFFIKLSLSEEGAFGLDIVDSVNFQNTGLAEVV